MTTHYTQEMTLWSESGGEYFSRCDRRYPVEIKEDDYVKMLDAVQTEFIKDINSLKKNFYENSVKVSNLDLKIIFPSLTTKQKEDCEKAQEESNKKKLKKDEFIGRMNAMNIEAVELGLKLSLTEPKK